MSNPTPVYSTANDMNRCRIADSLPGRTNKDCRKRWHNSVAGGLKKGQWSKSEDQLLSRGVQEYGQKYGSMKQEGLELTATKRWTVVASCVGTRSADRKYYD
jgi:myb proto-oncogene protein